MESSLSIIRAAEIGSPDPLILRTSDRILFKRCRRLWGWLSHNRQGRTITHSPDFFWFGTGIHFALEDYHGFNYYQHPATAYLAYVEASKRAGILPSTWQEHRLLGVRMMEYYADQWLRSRNPLATYVVDGVPQVEVNGAIDLGFTTASGRPVYYGFTIDRMHIDENGDLWVVEYKTAKRIMEYHLDVDDQVTAYAWAAWKLYKRKVAGIVYVQFRKVVPQLPKVLATGKVSTNMSQSTSAAMYGKLLQMMYGTIMDAPNPNKLCYNNMLAREDEDKDYFIARHRIERNEAQLLAFEKKVEMEVEDMANDNLPLYPNPTRECDWCPLNAACIAMDDGSDWQYILDTYSSRGQDDSLTHREKQQVLWREFLPDLNEVTPLSEADEGYGTLLGKLQEIEESDNVTPESAFLEEISRL